jgi:spore germination cell wall hydrolase CwlJ-like protein
VEPISYDYSATDAYLLAKIAFGEAGGEDVEGRALVIRVVLNRVWSDDFPDSIPEVIYQTDTDVQFAATTAVDWDDWQPTESCWEALELVESGWDESQGALYFCAGGESPWHRENLTELFTHGGHTFYK